MTVPLTCFVPRPGRILRLIGMMIVLVLIVAIALFCIIAMMGSLPWMLNLYSHVLTIRWEACALHLVLIGVLWWKWPVAVEWLIRRYRLRPEIRQSLAKARSSYALCLLAVEALLQMTLFWSN